MTILTVRLTAEEARLLEKRSKSAGMKKATYIRKLIREEPFITAKEVVADAEHRMGDSRLHISRK
jgi:predicted DNA-binding protein